MARSRKRSREEDEANLVIQAYSAHGQITQVQGLQGPTHGLQSLDDKAHGIEHKPKYQWILTTLHRLPEVVRLTSVAKAKATSSFAHFTYLGRGGSGAGLEICTRDTRIEVLCWYACFYKIWRPD